MKYVFILGRNAKLSAAEIKAILPNSKILSETDIFLILENENFEAKKMLNRLGGTIKIGEVVAEDQSSEYKEIIIENLKNNPQENKLNFGVSFYGTKPWKLGMEIKGELKAQGVSCRLVISRDQALSSVVVSKNKVQEFLVLGKKYLGKTLAVQEFEEYSARDYGRPGRDLVSGMMPPKLAKIMINLSQATKDMILLDPFCGSGTVIQEALLMGYQNIIGTDLSEKAIKDTKQNLDWLKNRGYNFSDKNYKIQICDVRDLSKKIKEADVIVTEPFLGPPLKGRESLVQVKKIVQDLGDLYLKAFTEFKKVLKPNGRVVIIFPSFRVSGDILELPILDKIENMNFTKLNQDKLIYSRPNQMVWRQINIFQKEK